MWNKPTPKQAEIAAAPCKWHSSGLILLLLMPLLTLLLSLTGNERLGQFMLLMTGPMVVLALAANRRPCAWLFKKNRPTNDDL